MEAEVTGASSGVKGQEPDTEDMVAASSHDASCCLVLRLHCWTFKGRGSWTSVDLHPWIFYAVEMSSAHREELVGLNVLSSPCF